jgi:endogenous inhibitor of DNA gyrase (YacG/DUF329 family)
MAETLYWILGRGTFVADELALDASPDSDGMSAFQVLNAAAMAELHSCNSCGKPVARVADSRFRLAPVEGLSLKPPDFLNLSGAHHVAALAVSQPALALIRAYCPDVRVRDVIDPDGNRLEDWLQIGCPGTPARWLPHPEARGRACGECGRDIVDARKNPRQWVDASATSNSPLLALGADPWQRLHARGELADALQGAGFLGLTLLDAAELR